MVNKTPVINDGGLHKPLADTDKIAGATMQLSADAGNALTIGSDKGLFVPATGKASYFGSGNLVSKTLQEKKIYALPLALHDPYGTDNPLFEPDSDGAGLKKTLITVAGDTFECFNAIRTGIVSIFTEAVLPGLGSSVGGRETFAILLCKIIPTGRAAPDDFTIDAYATHVCPLTTPPMQVSGGGSFIAAGSAVSSFRVVKDDTFAYAISCPKDYSNSITFGATASPPPPTSWTYALGFTGAFNAQTPSPISGKPMVTCGYSTSILEI
ncbi:hypothetical protein SAMN05444172_2586 [Burkholderia sp. GAS332]|nr:hypothetical protein SAMN05444172_2586 [Burkholderia sp. GAS332]